MTDDERATPRASTTTGDADDPLLRAIAHAPPQEPVTILSGDADPSGQGPWPFASRFRLISELARGGMGRVVVAHDEQLRREVAIKEVLRSNAWGRRRFEREALLTARLQHPGIVSVYELVRREGGEPALVMRRVHGRPFDRVLAGTRTLADRLALLAPFTSACDAVAYAHKAQVIHRDLKPANVLLGDFGDTVVIDWGLAKDLAAPAEEAPGAPAPEHRSHELTAEGAVMGTPVYMAPEQARGEPAGPPADVYALGAMLYELLSGRRAYLETDAPAALRAVLGGPPPPLASLVPELAPELATLVARAMAREPKDRFADAGGLAEELKRFQAGRLLLSHSYSTAELVRRWARRHAAALAMSGVFLAVLAALGALSVRRIVAERDRANREAEVTRRVSEFMTRMFKVSDPSEARGSSVTAREILDRAAADIDQGLAAEPLVQAALMARLGGVYLQLGLLAKAEALYRRSLELRRRLLGPEDPITLGTLSSLGTVLLQQGHAAEAEKISRELLAGDLQRLGPEDPDTLACKTNLANALNEQGKAAEAEKLYREVAEVRGRVLGPEHPETLDALANLATALRGPAGKVEKERIYRTVSEAQRRSLGPDHPDTLRTLANHARALIQLGRLQEAEPILRQVAEARRRVLGPEHPATLSTLGSLANTVQRQGRPSEAEKLDREVWEIRKRVLGPEHPSTLISLSNVAYSLYLQKSYPEAERLQREVLAARRRVIGPEHADTVNTLANLSGTLKAERRWPEAEASLRETLALQRKVLGPEDDDTLDTTAELAETLAAEGRAADAEALYLELLGLQRHKGASADARATLRSLAGLAAKRDRAQALSWLRQAVDAGMTAAEAEAAAADAGLAPLRGDAGFEALLREARGRTPPK